MENNNLNQHVLDKLTKVCVCKAVPKSKIKDAITAGSHTIEEVAKVTGACSGGCKGYRCTPKIQELIETHLSDS